MQNWEYLELLISDAKGKSRTYAMEIELEF